MSLEHLQHREQLRERVKQALGPLYEEPVPAATAEQIKRGGKLYPQLCAPCHGGRGDGAGHNADAILGRPSNFTDPIEASYLSEMARVYIIENGVPGTAMVGWMKVLPESDILALYHYIKSLKKER